MRTLIFKLTVLSIIGISLLFTGCLGQEQELTTSGVIDPKNCRAEEGKFLCKSGTLCLNATEVCDRIPQCDDRSDEFSTCDTICKKPNSNCDQLCMPKPDGAGHTCYCHFGYQISGMDKDWCEDIDECKIFGSCSQKCKNVGGSFRCSCLEGFELEEDNVTCSPTDGAPQLLYAMKDSIRVYSLKEKRAKTIVENQGQTIAVTFDANQGYVYWTDITFNQESIVRSKIDGSDVRTIVDTGLISPEGIAFDWIARNIYFTDSNKTHVGVCDADGISCSILFREPSDKPREIAVHPALGYLFVTDWGEKAAIIRSGMDGSYPFPLITDLKWPNGLSIDHGNSRIYWTDAGLDLIETATIDGKDRQVVRSTEIKHPFSLDVFGDTIYWSDWTLNRIQSCNKFTGKNSKTLITIKRDQAESLHGLAVYHIAAQTSKIQNPCENKPCSHLCVLTQTKNKFRCLCPTGMLINKDEKTCSDDPTKPKLLIGHNNIVKTMRFDSIGKNIMDSRTFKELHTIGAVLYNPINDTYLISDIIMKKIFEYNPRTQRLTTLVDRHLDAVEGMDIDIIGHNLYWIDTGKRTLEVMSFKTRARFVMLKESNKPRDLVIVPELKEVFVATVSTRGGQIIRLGLNGYTRNILVNFSKGRGEPIALTYNREKKQLYWVDAIRNSIESISVDGKSTLTAVTYAGSPYSLASIGNKVYWTDRHLQSLSSLTADTWETKAVAFIGDSSSNSTLSVASYLLGNFYNSISIINRDMGYAANLMKSHECSPNAVVQSSSSGKSVDESVCSHICLVSSTEENKGTCVCPEGMLLDSDGKTCSFQKTCFSTQFGCSDGTCIDKKWTCDGSSDCPNGEDEKDCKEIETCRVSDFVCESDNICVPGHWKCDGENDCVDGSDEKNCTFKQCITKTDFRCQSGRCIPLSWVCDHSYDCPDRSDELNCPLISPSSETSTTSEPKFPPINIAPAITFSPSSSSSTTKRSRERTTERTTEVTTTERSSRRKNNSKTEFTTTTRDLPTEWTTTTTTSSSGSPRIKCSKGYTRCLNDFGDVECVLKENCPKSSKSNRNRSSNKLSTETEAAPSTLDSTGPSIVTGIFIGLLVILMVAVLIFGGIFYVRKHGISRPKVLIRPYTQRWVKYVNHPMQRFFGEPTGSGLGSSASREGDHIYQDIGFDDEERGYNTYTNPGYEDIDGAKIMSKEDLQTQTASGTGSERTSLSYGDSGIMNVTYADCDPNNLYDDPDDLVAVDGHYISYSQRAKLIDNN